MKLFICEIKASGVFLIRELSGVQHECPVGATLISYQETGERLEIKKLSCFASKLAETKT